MHAWLIQTGEPWPLEPGQRALRTGLVARALISRGWDVTWWLAAFEHQRKKWMTTASTRELRHDGIRIRVLRGVGYKRNVGLARYLDHRIVAKAFRREASIEPSPELVFASLPCHHLAFEAARFCSRRAVPLCIDIRDQWPDIFTDRISSPHLRSLASVALFHDSRRTSTACAHADALTSVSHGYLNWGLQKAGRSRSASDAVFPPGYPSVSVRSNYEAPPAVERLTRQFPGARLIAFVGTLGRSYEIDLLLDVAESFLIEGRRNVAFVIAGAGEQRNHIIKRVEALPNVGFTGWLDAAAIATVLERSYAGLLPCRSAADTVPNKAFEYLSHGLPLISSIEGELARDIDLLDLGFNYRAGDRAALREAIDKLLGTPERQAIRSNNARAFFEAHGDAERVYARLADHLELVAVGSGHVSRS
jgi:glycosyltransferase involved in cell wall biosynthesis